MSSIEMLLDAWNAEPDETTLAEYALVRRLPDGRLCGVKRLLFHWTIHVGITFTGHDERYCYATFAGAASALEAWDGEGEPDGWHKHPSSGRRRDPATGETWDEHDPRFIGR
jgi:hypothetical protein